MSGETATAADIKLLIDKRFKPHATALFKCSQFSEAAQVAAEYAVLALQVGPVCIAAQSAFQRKFKATACHESAA